MKKIKLMRLLLRLFWLFPVRNDRVVLNSFNGRLFSCSPKYLALGLADTGRFKVYFVLRDGSKAVLPDGMIRLRYCSVRHFYMLMTSKYIVVNSTGFTGMLPYRKKQILINTWHGAGMFKVSGANIFKTKAKAEQRRIFGNNTRYFLSSSASYTDRQSQSMEIPKEKFIATGLPRNDIFFRDHPEIVQRVRQHYSISDAAKIILYAPTYRDGKVTSLQGYGFAMLDPDRVIEACKARFGGEFVFLFKAHHDMIPENISPSCINASDYPDTQELLYAADVLISDYSSLQWDYALTRKPGFMYAPDIPEYTSVHPFASDYHDWPFAAAASNEELDTLIRDYDEEAGRRRIDAYLKGLGSYEEGQAVRNTLRIAFGLDV